MVEITSPEPSAPEHEPDAAPEPNASPIVTSDWLNKSYEILNGSLGIAKFNQAIPLIISAIAIGVSLVNRNFPKCIGHVLGATMVALISAVIISRKNNATLLCNQFTTAFLWYTIFYIAFCMQDTKTTLNTNTLVGVIMGFIILVFVDFVTFMGGVCADMESSTYILMMLLGIAGGIGGFYITLSLGGKESLYDFGGCSCGNCSAAAQRKCAVGSKTQTILAKQIKME
jgi:hypothetical protein